MNSIRYSRRSTDAFQAGKVYLSKSATAKAVVHAFGLDPEDNFVWYKIIKKAPERFAEG